MVARSVGIFLAFMAAASCVTPNRVIVREGREGDKSVREIGVDVELSHLPTDGYVDQRVGYHVLHSSDDWLRMWKEPRPDHKNPPAPPLDWSSTMAIVATSGDPDATGYAIERAVQTGRTLHVYVDETLPGRKCKAPPPRSAPRSDIVTLPATDLDVMVHVSRELEDSCGRAPDVVVTCKVEGQTVGTGKLQAAPGAAVECDGTKVSVDSGVVTGRNWGLRALPTSSFTQLAIEPGALRAKLTLDAFGSYAIGLEVSDSQDKQGRAQATIEVAPPPGATVLQLGWTKFDPKDDPSTFPRYELHVTDLSRRADCTLAAPKPWCDIKSVGSLEQVTLRPAPKSRYAVAVTYVDDRFQGAPVLCFRNFVPGAKVVETCDDTVRAPASVWAPGALDLETGAFEDMTRPHVSAPADAGAPTP